MSVRKVLSLLVAASVACTPAQVAAVDAYAREAAAIIGALAPEACAIVDVTDPANAAGICQVITDVSTGATAIVPVFGTLSALAVVVAAKPPNAAVAQAVTGTRVKARARK